MMASLREHRVVELYHVTRIENLASIARIGLQPKNRLVSAGRTFADISIPSAQHRRSLRTALVSATGRPLGIRRPLHDLVPLYINPRNPMMFRIRNQAPDLCLVVVSALGLCDEFHEIAFSDGNMASDRSTTYSSIDELDRINWPILRAETWTDFEDGKRARCAEFMVSPSIEPGQILRIETCSSRSQAKAERAVANSSMAVQIAPEQFYYSPKGPAQSNSRPEPDRISSDEMLARYAAPRVIDLLRREAAAEMAARTFTAVSGEPANVGDLVKVRGFPIDAPARILEIRRDAIDVEFEAGGRLVFRADEIEELIEVADET